MYAQLLDGGIQRSIGAHRVKDMFSGLQIENIYTFKTYIFGKRLFNVCKCQMCTVCLWYYEKGLDRS